ncbi:MAG: helix-turn-helix domain-containing protein, partial [Phycisphaerae bacterium]
PFMYYNAFMSKTPGRPLMGTWRYAPFIHWGDTNPRHIREVTDYTPRNVYALTYVEDGQAWLGSRGKPGASGGLPTAVLQSPRAEPLTITPGSTYQRLHFDVVRVPCRRADDSRALIHVDPVPQPSPQEVWGIDLPSRVPEELQLSCHAMLSYCTANWYRDDLSLMQCNTRLGIWITELVCHVVKRHSSPRGWAEAAVASLENIVDQRTRIEQVAAFLGMSRTTFTRRFREEMGVTPREYLARLRLDKACRLLESTNVPIRRVALRCGSRSAKTFALQFKKRLGYTPSEWRRRSRM